jgi:transposase
MITPKDVPAFRSNTGWRDAYCAGLFDLVEMVAESLGENETRATTLDCIAGCVLRLSANLDDVYAIVSQSREKGLAAMRSHLESDDLTYSEIAERFGLRLSTVSYYARQWGLSRSVRARSKRAEQEAKVLEMAKQPYVRASDIVRATGVSRFHVDKILKEAGVTLTGSRKMDTETEG